MDGAHFGTSPSLLPQQVLAGEMDAEAAARAFGLPGDNAGRNIRKRVQRVRLAQEEENQEEEQVAKRMRHADYSQSWKRQRTKS